ncbi:hypothetical protein C8J57DRAFT_1491376 [Mycena rebaudengoi]|nr:hypothetical protein C8J57DRAFT_1491376 [Mycena rebaudengoi]
MVGSGVPCIRTWLGLDGPTSPVRAVSVLCRDEDFAGKQYVSLRVSVDSDTESQRLVNKGWPTVWDMVQGLSLLITLQDPAPLTFGSL